ncbi:MAG: hypothetical protein EAX86_10055 [Candidatus Heimdallarchaeota archaeon]|nr:hypothetical protein [Candidatus Heimdallarchaeota archaeon]
MSLNDQLKIEPTKVISAITNFITPILDRRGIEGVVILYKKDLECAVNVEIAKMIVGEKNIRLVVTKGRFTDKQPRETMTLEEVRNSINLPKSSIIFINKERILNEIQSSYSEKPKLSRGLMASDYLPIINYNLSYYLLRSMISSEIREKTFKAPTKRPTTNREKFFQRSIANYKTQVRLRMLLAFLVAESENKSYFSNINKSEWLLGLFTKFGSYHAADFLPLGNVYRTQVFQLAKHLGVEKIIENDRPIKPSSYEFFFGHSADEVDKVLIRLEQGLAIEIISKETEVPVETVQKILTHYESSDYARYVPQIPRI